MSILDNISGGIGGAVRVAEQAASTLIGGPAASVVGPLMGDLLQGPGQSLFSELPQAFSGLFNSVQQDQQTPFQATPLPFSLAASGISNTMLQNPDNLVSSLSSAVNKGQSIGGFLDNLDTAGVDNQVTSLMNNASKAAQSGDAMTAEKDVIQAQTLFQTISQLINQIGSLQKEALQNSKLT